MEITVPKKVYKRVHVKSKTTFTLKDLRVKNAIFLGVFHLVGLYGATYIPYVSYQMLMYFVACWSICGLGITAGYHRLWAHKSYKASTPLKYFLLYMGTMAGQGSVIWWCRDHRVHHPYSETDADPHNAERGFFYSHIGWLLTTKPQAVIDAGKKTDMSDLTSDPILQFQNKYFSILSLTFSFIVPYFVGLAILDDTTGLFWFACAFRHLWVLHCTFTVNSLAHFIGERDYDSRVSGTDNLLVSLLSLGEGHHNYHHKYPFDYKTSYKCWSTYNPTAWFLTVMHWVGLAYDMKQASEEVVQRGLKRSMIYNTLDNLNEMHAEAPNKTIVEKFSNELEVDLKKNLKEMSLDEVEKQLTQRINEFIKTQ